MAIESRGEEDAKKTKMGAVTEQKNARAGARMNGNSRRTTKDARDGRGMEQQDDGRNYTSCTKEDGRRRGNDGGAERCSKLTGT